MFPLSPISFARTTQPRSRIPSARRRMGTAVAADCRRSAAGTAATMHHSVVHLRPTASVHRLGYLRSAASAGARATGPASGIAPLSTTLVLAIFSCFTRFHSVVKCSPALHPLRIAMQPAPSLPLQKRRELAQSPPPKVQIFPGLAEPTREKGLGF